MRRLLAGAVVVILIPVVLVAWWLLSPLFIDREVDEELPFTVNATIPENMDRSEVEQVMAGMAKVEQEVDESMPRSMGGTSGMNDTADTTPAVLKAGTFRDADDFHQGSGKATIYQGPDGLRVLRLEEFRVTNGPDLHVILAPHPNPGDREDVTSEGYIDLGSLKGNIRNQNYPIPLDVDIDAEGSVVVYCLPFHVVFSVASLEGPE